MILNILNKCLRIGILFCAFLSNDYLLGLSSNFVPANRGDFRANFAVHPDPDAEYDARVQERTDDEPGLEKVHKRHEHIVPEVVVD